MSDTIEMRLLPASVMLLVGLAYCSFVDIVYASPPPGAVPATVCEVNHAVSARQEFLRIVSITAFLNYDFEYGFFLQDPRCQMRKDLPELTFLLRIDNPPNKSGWDDPELTKAATQDWLKEVVGKRIYCTCIGTISYSDGYPKFVLDHAERVWASSEDILK